MQHHTKPSYRCFAVVDIEGSGSRADPVQEWLNERMYELVHRATEAAGLPAEYYTEDDRGDGVLLIFQPDVTKVDITEAFSVRLHAELRRYARVNSAESRMRLRVALHGGDVSRREHGWIGRNLNTTFRLVESDAVRRVLRCAADSPLALIVSDHWYQAVVIDDRGMIESSSYAPVRVRVKELDAAAWVHVPGLAVPPVPDAGSTRTEQPRKGSPDSPAGSGNITFNGPVDHRGDVVTGGKTVVEFRGSGEAMP